MSERKRAINGKVKSPPTEVRSTSLPTLKIKDLQERLARVYEFYQSDKDRSNDAQDRQNFIFHMTDWLNDWQRLQEFYSHPDSLTNEEAAKVVSSFLYHALGHLNAAGRLLLDYAPGDFFLPVESASDKK